MRTTEKSKSPPRISSAGLPIAGSVLAIICLALVVAIGGAMVMMM